MEDVEHPWKKTELIGVLLMATLVIHSTVYGEVISRLPTNQKVVALTFDACETRDSFLF